MPTARVLAQAKVNLVLHVLAREASGYHSIETVFLRLDLADDVRVRIAEGRSLDCSGTSIPSGSLGPTEKNLAYRAAIAYSDAVGWPSGFAIEVDKRIPVGAGLGGGSADAGAVLRAFDAMSPSPLGPRLIDLAVGLGADVPFMTIESPMALGWGRGERLFPLPALEPRSVAIVVPNFPIATPDAYSWVSADRGSYEPTAAVISPGSVATWEEVVAIANNDFEDPVARRHPEIAEVVDDLAARDALVAMLSGSGSTVFGVFAAPPDVAAITRSTGYSTISTRTSDRVYRVEID
jgi:4-diphosphocytidyl-2-C-methyl-D-erythritol kinase